jgi:hypothetical protein
MASPVAHYVFLPWYRTGLSTAVDANPAGDRGEIKAKLKTKVGAADEDSPPQTIKLVGPGDLIGIDPRAIVRLDPRPSTNDFEPNYLAAIEFFDEDYAWRYTPRAPEGSGNTRLIPWLALIVLEAGEFERAGQGEGLPPAIRVPNAAQLPPAEDLWAWAHTHINASAADPANPRPTAALLRGNPALGCCRIVAAHRLQQNKSYHAMLVPAFEAGRRAGLPGSSPTNRLLAWGRTESVDLPVYFEWTFRTGERGDFEALVRRLNPAAPDRTVGRRPMNMSRPLPGMALPPIRNGDAQPRPVLDLEGALQLPSAKPSPWEATSRANFQQWLADFINLGEAWALDTAKQVAGAPPLPNGITLPIVLPPSYGRWHANIPTLEPVHAGDRWLEELNLDPRNRVAAAFGALVVQKNQEDFMARAWAQYGELFRANRLRYRAQFMREMLTAAEAKHFAPLPAVRMLAVTNLAHARVTAATRLTVFGMIESSALPVAAVRPVMRRVLRDRGPVARRYGLAMPHLSTLIGNVASGRIAVAPAWSQPEERLSLATRPTALEAATQTPWLGNDWDVQRPRLVTYSEQTGALIPFFPQLKESQRIVRDLIALGDRQSVLSAAQLTPLAIREVGEAPDWMPPTARELGITPRPEDLAPARESPTFSFVAWNFRQAALDATEWLSIPLPDAPVRKTLDVQAAVKALRTQLSPYSSVSERVSATMKLPPVVKVAAYDPLEAIMTHPKFDDATYEYLKKISDEYVVPNLSKIPNNTVTLLEANWRFIESFLVGVNHEMARELLWRGYRTDQRGTYFDQFWDIKGVPAAKKGDIHPIHGWKLGGKLTMLGENRPADRVIKNNLVLVVRGDVLRRYPNTLVYAVKAVANNAPRHETFKNVSRRPGDDTPANVIQPILFAKFDPDIYCFGFDLAKDEARGKLPPEATDLGWYFVLAQRFGEPRFGLDDPDTDTPSYPRPPRTQSDDLTWADVARSAAEYSALSIIDLAQHGPVTPPGGFQVDPDTAPSHRAAWATHAGDMAAIFLQTPFRMYFHANDMLLP